MGFCYSHVHRMRLLFSMHAALHAYGASVLYVANHPQPFYLVSIDGTADPASCYGRQVRSFPAAGNL